MPGDTRERVVEAATAVHADHFIRTLPDGYDTVLDADGPSARLYAARFAQPSAA